MKVKTGFGVNARLFEIKGNCLVDLSNELHSLSFKSEATLLQWVESRIKNGLASLYI